MYAHIQTLRNQHAKPNSFCWTSLLELWAQISLPLMLVTVCIHLMEYILRFSRSNVEFDLLCNKTSWINIVIFLIYFEILNSYGTITYDIVFHSSCANLRELKCYTRSLIKRNQGSRSKFGWWYSACKFTYNHFQICTVFQSKPQTAMIAFALWDAGELEKNTQQKVSQLHLQQI